MFNLLKNKRVKTIIKSASVKVMLSYDYSHFEAKMSLENDNGISLGEMDAARKDCQRLADKAIAQYKKAKELAGKRTNSQYFKNQFENDCKKIAEKDPGDRTVKEIAMLKQYQDKNWQAQFQYPYDYEDDELDYDF